MGRHQVSLPRVLVQEVIWVHCHPEMLSMEVLLQVMYPHQEMGRP